MQAPLFLTQMCKKHLEKNQGVVINMVDIHAERPLKDHTLYCMAKAALVTMTESLAQEMAPAVRVNGVAPGAIMWPEKHLDEQDKKQILKQIPLNKLGSQRDIAQAIHFLIEASYITGHILKVDGGRSIASQAKA
jgi:pteridine reductase